MSKGKQRGKQDMTVTQERAGAETTAGKPAFNGELPHGTKKVSLGPNTKR